jgi:sulfate adenylyltransferase subunit 2
MAGSRQGRAYACSHSQNWTESDVWQYIERENIPVVPFYFAKKREMLVQFLIPVEHSIDLQAGERPQMIMCRMRSLGCTYCTGAIRSRADTVGKIIEESRGFRRSERENRLIDHDQEASMEMKKREGYF